MKKLAGIIVVCLVSAIFAWSAWPTTNDLKHQHDNMSEGVHSYSGQPSDLTKNSDWVKISDDCDKCVVNDTDRKCGKCGGFLSEKCTEVKGGYIYYTLTCKICSHNCKYKVKYN